MKLGKKEFYGGVFTILIEFSIINYDIGIAIAGVIMFIYSLVVQFISWGIRRRQNAVVDPLRFKVNTTDEEDEIEFLLLLLYFFCYTS